MRTFSPLLIFCALTLASVPAGRAATVTVSTTTDEVNGNTASIAALIGTPGGAGISLREAIIAANNTAGADIITLPAGTYTLTRAGNDATAQLGDLDINGSLTLNGAGSATTIIQGASDAAFTGSIGDKVIGINQDGTFTNLTVNIAGVTIRYGRNTVPDGNPDFAYTGGGVDVFLTGTGNFVSFTNCAISGNENVNSYGGGVNIDSGTSFLSGDPAVNTVNRGTVVFSGCTVAGNKAKATGGGFNLFSDSHNVIIENCAITNNLTTGLGGTGAQGGGLNVRHTYNVASSVTIRGCTIAGNATASVGGGVGVSPPNAVPVSLDRNTIRNNSAVTSGGGVQADGGAGGGALTASFNRMVSNTAPTGSALAQSSGTATAQNNWWGTHAPAALIAGTVTFTPWLQLTHTANPNTRFVPNPTTLTASFLTNSAGTAIAAANLSAMAGVPVTFNNAARGTLSGAQTTVQASGTATATFTANAVGVGSADAVVDSQTVTALITIPTGVSSINRVHATPTNLNSVQWTVTFTNAVSGVAAGNFTLVNVGLGGVPAITSVTAVGGTPATQWTVTASTGSGSGTLGLNMVNGSGISASIANLPFTGQVYAIDMVAPTVTCSSNITVTANGNCPAVVNFTVAASDNVALANATTNPASGSAFPLGTNTVTVTARDTAGNTNFCTFKVTVVAGAAPQLSIVRSGTNVVVSWTNLFPCYALQTAPLLASNSWSLYPGPFATNSGNIFVTNSAALTNRFYRLSF